MLEFLKEKKNQSLDTPETTLQHRAIVMRKKILKKLYIDWYNSFVNQLPDLPCGKIIEIGSGGGFLKQLLPDIITSDVLKLPHIDMVFSAEKLPFENQSVSAIFLMDVLHHIPDSEKFFEETQRVLCRNGILFMIEPANTWFSRFIFKKFHHEPFNEHATTWQFPSSGPLSDANIALPWIIFTRDRIQFEKNYSQLCIRSVSLHTPFRYLISGGLSYKSPFPSWAFGSITIIEKLLSPLYPFLAMFQTIYVVKK